MMRNFLQLIIGLLLFFCTFEAEAQRRAKYELGSKSKQVVGELAQAEKKEIYRVDFILPIYAQLLPDSLTVLKEFPQEGLIGLHFYEGILLAIDSLEKSQRMYYDYYVHDIGSTPANELIRSGVLDSTDVIVGMVQGNDIPELAQLAKDKGITFYSALSAADQGISGNLYFVMLQPTLRSHIQHLIKYLEYNKAYLNTVQIYHQDNKRDKSKTLVEELFKSKIKSIQINNNYDFKNLKYYLDKGKTTVVFVSELNPERATEMLRQLNALAEEYPMDIIGMPTWKGLPILTSGELNEKISVYLSYPYRYDEEIEKRQEMRKKYAVFNRGIPNEMVYRGYETTLWVAQVLEQLGTPSHHLAQNIASYSTEYNVEKIEDDGKLLYFENTNTYIYKYHNGTLSLIE